MLTAALLLFSWSLSAQNSFYGGFKAGMNFATIDGPLELGNNGEDLESFSYTTGFHVGVNFNLNLTDYFGLRGEVIYGQRGAEYDFSGQSSFMPFYRADEMGNLMASGTRNTKISITNTYLDLPVSAFIRFGRLELSGGLSLGVLLASRAVGEIRFDGVSPQGENTNVVFIVDGSYFDTDAFDVNNPGTSEEIRIDGRRVVLPESIGTYYDNPNPDQSLFNTLDASVQGGLSFYLNQGLFISFKGYYGLMDITRNEADYSVLELDNDQSLIFKSDDDRNITLQASVGFHF